MSESVLNKKKRLLIQRDELLEEIGQAIFESEELPNEFKMLPQEFNSMDILLSQLKERYRALKEERDKVRQDVKAILQRMTVEDKHFEDALRPKRQLRDELALRVRFQKDQLRKRLRKQQLKRPRKKEDAVIPAELRQDYEKMQGQCDELEGEKEAARKACRNELKPLEDRVQDLDLTIRKVHAEEEQLSSHRKKRLRDLGFWYHNRHPDATEFGPRFGQLKLLRLELAESNKKQPVELPPLEPEKPEARENRGWIWVVVFFLVAGGLGYLQRTRYRVDNVPLEGIAVAFQANAFDYRVYADLTDNPPATLNPDLPDLSELPGSIAFRDMGPEDITAFVVSRDKTAEGDLRFCGLHFRRVPTRFPFRLAQEGWTNLATEKNWRAMVRGGWVWIILNERTYFLTPEDQVDRFLDLTYTDGGPDLVVQKPLPGFDSNRPLLFGYRRVRWLRNGSDSRFELRTEALLNDLPLRRDYVRSVLPEEGPVRVSFEGVNLILETTGLPVTDVGSEGLQRHITMLADRALTPARSSQHNPSGLPAPENAEGEHSLLVFRDKTDHLEELFELPVDHPVDDLTYDVRGSLFALDQEGRSLYRYAFQGGGLVPDGRVNFSEYDTQDDMQDFRPGRLVPAPDGTGLLLLETRRKGGPPRLVFVSPVNLQVLWVEVLPEGVRRADCAAWDAASERLYVGCGKGRRTDAGLVVINRTGYRLDVEETVTLTPGRKRTYIAAILLTPEAAYLQQLPEGRLIRFELAGHTSDVLEPDQLERSNVGDRAGPNHLLLSRTGELLFMLDPLGDSRADKAMRLIRRDRRPEFLGSLPFSTGAFSMVRIPLTDRLWVSRPEEDRLISVMLRKGKLESKQLRLFTHFTPRHLALDEWGHHLFVAGKRHP
ncbi:MAG: hypothetical protein QNK37_10425 [Acidobacteriota bacterium]|nr:hypothetical protein [Acidobacteriota bacterium]